MAITASPTAGTFTCAELLKIQVAADRIWADNQMAQDYKPEVGVLEAIRKEQTAILREIENPEKDRTLKIFWAADCNEGTEDCDDDCEIGGAELEAQCKEYALDLCQRVGFNVKEKMFRNSELTREQVVAKAMLKKMKALDEYLARTMVAKLNSFAGENQFDQGATGTGVVGSGATYIAPSYWTPDIYGYFAQVIVMNKLNNAFLIHGSNLYQMYWLAQMNNLNTDQKDQLAKINSIPSYWDMFNIDAVNSPDKVSYLVTKGAVAFANKAYYPSVPVEYLGAGQLRYSVESNALPGVKYDVYYTNECTNNDIIHKWTLYVKAGIFLNPFGCNDEVTGVLKFICGTAPSGS
jgi:hypothetical protein